jgi:hypothetical protein
VLTVPIIALIGTVLGGVGLKIVEHLLGRRKLRDDTASQLRGELRIEIESLRQEIHKVESDVEQWREKYYLLLEQFLAMKVKLERAVQNATNG